MTQFIVCAMYKFVTLDNYQSLRSPLKKIMDEHRIRGTILLANEGLNGTVSGSREDIDALLAWLNSDVRLNPISYKESIHTEQPFYRTKVKLKKEIVTMGVDDIDPRHTVGTYVAPSDWNALISDPDVTVIDTRNDYEVDIGTFEHAISPNTKTFREFPEYVKKHLDPKVNKKVAMFCTGGIRCEKSTAYLKEQGFDEVYHLEGGILKYLEDIPQDESKWKGDCFVFDNRVAVNHNLEKSHYVQCYACRLPITEEDKNSDKYEPGVACPKCYGTHTEQQIERFREREKQVTLAKSRNEEHVGSEARELTAFRREQKAEAQRNRAIASKQS